MAKFNVKAYTKFIEGKVSKAINKTMSEVADAAEESMYNVIKENVYEKYTPKMYERRAENNGLLDRSNILSESSRGKLWVYNVTRPNTSIIGQPFTSDNPSLFEWIDQGKIIHMPGVRYKPWVNQRKNLIGKMYDDFVSSGELRRTLFKGIKKELK